MQAVVLSRKWELLRLVPGTGAWVTTLQKQLCECARTGESVGLESIVEAFHSGLHRFSGAVRA